MTDNPTGQHRPTGRAAAVLARARALPPWNLLAAGVLLGGLTGAGYGALTPPSYSATAYVIAVPDKTADPASADGFAQAYGRVATQVSVLGDAQVWAGVPMRTLQKSVRAATSPDAPMVAVTATSERADLAADMANAVTGSMTRHANDNQDSTHVRLVQFSRAVKPAGASSASPSVTGLVGAAAGGLLGGLALLVRPRRADDSAQAASVPGPAVAAEAHGQL
ncbi:lipopolysaccharide biosynthesis protein [Streptomyces sp. NPDC059785]|uniref:lipopolysaccharide biosynthesis protein n=1 Tax=unclassified Streptomyces TaxID=2593676 RepID=UPI0036482CF4